MDMLEKATGYSFNMDSALRLFKGMQPLNKEGSMEPKKFFVSGMTLEQAEEYIRELSCTSMASTRCDLNEINYLFAHFEDFCELLQPATPNFSIRAYSNVSLQKNRRIF